MRAERLFSLAASFLFDSSSLILVLFNWSMRAAKALLILSPSPSVSNIALSNPS